MKMVKIERGGISVSIVKECANLVEVDVVVEWQGTGEAGGAQPGNGVPAHWEEDESHVKLQRLGGALGGGEAVAHDVERVPVAVLYEFPGEEPRHESDPQRHHPQPLPVLLHVVGHLGGQLPDWSLLPQPGQVLAQRLARVAQCLAVVEVRVLLQQQRLQLPKLSAMKIALTGIHLVKVLISLFVNTSDRHGFLRLKGNISARKDMDLREVTIYSCSTTALVNSPCTPNVAPSDFIEDLK